jgi:transposase
VCPIAETPLVVTVRGMSYPSDLTDGQWALLEPVFNVPGKRGRKHANDLRTVVDAMLYIALTGCQWRYLPESFGLWTRMLDDPATATSETVGGRSHRVPRGIPLRRRRTQVL